MFTEHQAMNMYCGE